MKKEMVYLACPYSNKNEHVRNHRVKLADRCAAWILKQGYNVFSPLSHSHRVARYLDNHNDSNFWVDLDLPFISICDFLAVLKIYGYQESSGIKKEVISAVLYGKGIKYINYDNGRFSWE